MRLKSAIPLNERRKQQRLDNLPAYLAKERRYREKNREVARARTQAWRDKNPGRGAASAAAWRSRNPDHQMQKYGLTVVDYERMVSDQDGRCLICEKVPPDKLCVDHCHNTGKVRGLLCRKCNAAIGQLGDTVAHVRRALTYLENSLDGTKDTPYPFNSHSEDTMDSTTSQITGGTIFYEDGKKAAEEYAPARKAKVELIFVCAEGSSMAAAQTTIDHVAWMAENKVREMVGLPTIAEPQGRPGPTADVGPTMGETAKPTRTRKAKEPAPEPEAKPEPADVLDMGSVEDVIALPDQSDPTDMSAFDVEAAEPVVEITDADLNAAVSKKNAEINDAPAIRGVIAQFNPEPGKPFQLRQIAAGKRQAFIDKLAELKPAK